MNEYEAYHKELYDVLIQDNQREFMEFAKRQGMDLPQNIAEMTRHKAITGHLGLPEELRAKSRKWLIDRGHRPLD